MKNKMLKNNSFISNKFQVKNCLPFCLLDGTTMIRKRWIDRADEEMRSELNEKDDRSVLLCNSAFTRLDNLAITCATRGF